MCKIIILRVAGLQKGKFHPIYIRVKGLPKLGLKEDSQIKLVTSQVIVSS